VPDDPRDAIRVLHVDDEPGVLDLTETFLERTGDPFAVETATSAEAGLEQIAEHRPDCVVSDYEMPGRDGLEFLQAVRERHPDLPFILFTGKGSEAVASDAVSAGVTDYLQKETGTQQYELLANRITNAVEQARTERKLRTHREQLERLHEATRTLITAETRSEVARQASETARDVLDLPLNGIHLYDPDRNVLVPETVTDQVHDVLGEPPTIAPGEGVAWTAYETGETRVYGDIREAPGVMNPDTPIRSELHVPIGEHGVLVLASLVPDDFTEADVTSAKILAANVEAALDRIERTRELERQHKLFEKVQDFADVGAWEWDPRRESGYYSEAVYRIYGVDSRTDKSPAADLEEFYHPEDRETLRTAFRRAVEEGEPYDVELRVVDAEGEQKWVRTRGDPQFENGTCARVRGTIQDVTERREHERKLNRLQQRTRALMHTDTRAETARVAIETAENVIGAPLSGVHLLNESGDTLEPVAVTDSIHEAFEQPPSYHRNAPDGSSSALAWDLFESGEVLRVDDIHQYDPLDATPLTRSVLIHPLGEYGIFVVSSTEVDAFTETDETLVEILATTLRAALDRVTRDEHRRQREQRLRRLHDVTLDLVQAEDRRTVAELAVEGAEEVLGFPLVMVRQYDPEQDGLVPAASTEGVDDVFDGRPVFRPGGGSFNWGVYETGESRVFDDVSQSDRAIDADTPLRSLAIFPLGEFGTLSAGSVEPATFGETDVFLGRLLATATEAAFERVDHRAELQRQRDDLERKNSRLEEFTNTVSHDLRNPLVVAEGQLELALEDRENERLAGALDAVRRSQALIDDLLELARTDSRIGEIESVQLEQVVSECWHHVDTSGSTLEVDTEQTIRADRGRLQQLLENLYRNAVDHNDREVTVTVGELEEGFYVEDDGRGIPEAERDDVFETGYTTTAGGTGFGLRIVAEIATVHGWSIGVSEGETGGARFEITGVETLD